MNDIQSYQFEPEDTLEEADDSDCFEESRIIEETSSTGNTDWCLCELCEPMDSDKEYICCHSVKYLNCIIADSNVKCISQHAKWLRY